MTIISSQNNVMHAPSGLLISYQQHHAHNDNGVDYQVFFKWNGNNMTMPLFSKCRDSALDEIATMKSMYNAIIQTGFVEEA